MQTFSVNMNDTPNLALPYILAAQAQKHVTHNEAIRALDCLVQLSVESRALTAPPSAPADGDRFLIAASPTGAWSGHANEVAAFQDGAWAFYRPKDGWSAWVADEGALLIYTAGAWSLFAGSGGGSGLTGPIANADLANVSPGTIKGRKSSGSGSPEDLSAADATALLDVFTGSGASHKKGLVPDPGATAGTAKYLREDGTWWDLSNVPLVGVNATADATNKLAIKSQASLFDNAGNGHQQKINKAAASDTASQLYQTNYSGRAEIGLTGDDDFHFKVSADGSTWREAIKIDRATGKVTFPQSGGPREVLTANRTYYVNGSTGSDSTNDGLSIGSPFATLQKAENVARTIDFNGFSVTISIGDGTYTAGVTVGQKVGQAGATNYRFTSTSADATKVIVSTTSASCFSCLAPCQIDRVTMQTTTSGSGIWMQVAGLVQYSLVIFGACATYCLNASAPGAKIQCVGAFTIAGNAGAFAVASDSCQIQCESVTITLTGTPAITQFVLVTRGGGILMRALTFSGSATGLRYVATMNGTIETGGGGASYFPGSSAGVTSTGGQCN
ncbi:hypothetical protein HYPP_02835 [Hyphomicrobium sp. ghe19]|nr:hypothetical protein HYPP_02835 [Hyphomicrobium sp. ghe19]